MQNRIGFISTGILILVLAYGVYRYYDLNATYRVAQEDFASTTNALQYENAQLNGVLDQLQERLSETDTLNNDLKALLGARTQENQQMGAQVQSLNETVNTLDKLTKTDKQLLQKYSSIYFLNENYDPQYLTNIEPQYLNRPDKPEQFITVPYKHLSDLIQAAHAAQIPLEVLSAYRSFGTQAVLKAGYSVTYGKGTANAFSADQGYSEHQLGTTVDFTTPEIGSRLIGFDKTSAYTWLQENAHKYGFILSYPKGNTHFIFEPWHWRYIGVELATKLKSEGKNFYDYDQREIDTYLIKFFD